MDSAASIEKPQPVLQAQSSLNPDQPNEPCNKRESFLDFDPCQNAKICSPFYLYNHDSPRPSQDTRLPSTKPSIQVSVRDLELGALTPSVTQEKINAQNKSGGRLKFWEKQKQCLTKPKAQKWLHTLPKKQRTIIKLIIAFIICGAMVGIAVGLAVGLHSNVYGSGKQLGH